DVRNVAAGRQESAVQRVLQAEINTPFDLSRGPLLRAHLIALASDHQIFTIAIHHIVSDAWSLRVLADELAEIYQAELTGRNHGLPPLEIQYPDYALWQRHWLSGRVLQEGIDFWKKRLTGVPTLLELPADRPRPAVQSFRGARESFSLPQPLTRALVELSRR